MRIVSEPDPNKPQINWIKYTDLGSIEMTANCPLCNSEIPSSHPALMFDSLQRWAESNGWHVFEGDYTYKVGYTFTVGGKTARVEAKKTTYSAGDIDDHYRNYGELPQGTTFDTYVVIEIDGAYFKKTGTGDSYGEVSWDGPLKIVTPTEKVVKIYE